METKSKRPEALGGTLSINAAIDTLGLARDTTSVKQAKDVFSSVSSLPITIRVRRIWIHVVRLLADVRRILRLKRIVFNWS